MSTSPVSPGSTGSRSSSKSHRSKENAPDPLDKLTNDFASLAVYTPDRLLYEPHKSSTRQQVIADITTYGPTPAPKVDLIARQHGTNTFAQRPSTGEPLTTFLLASGKQSPKDYLEGGRFHTLLVAARPIRYYVLPKAQTDPEDHLDVIFQFDDVRDTDWFMLAVRKRIHVQTRPAYVEIRVFCIAAVQFCEMAARFRAAFPGTTEYIPTVEEIDATFTGGYDGQMIIHACLSNYNMYSRGGVAPHMFDKALVAVGQHLDGFENSVRNHKFIDNSYDRPIMVLIVELSRHGQCQEILDDFARHPKGVVMSGIRMWALPYSESNACRPWPFYRDEDEDKTSNVEDSQAQAGSSSSIYHPPVAFEPRIPYSQRSQSDTYSYDRKQSVSDASFRHPSSSSSSSGNIVTPGLDSRFDYSQRVQPNNFFADQDMWPPSLDGNRTMSTRMSGNNIDRYRIELGQEHRSTVMFRNIPSDMSTATFNSMIQMFAPGLYTFTYVRKDFSTGRNVGYAFVDFLEPGVILIFLDQVVGESWPGSRKRIDMSFATCQGREALIERFRNSVVMTEPLEHRPRLFHYRPDPLAGMEMDFPPADNQMKLFRSIHSAADVGLFTHGRRVVRQGNYDLGNPRGDAALTDVYMRRLRGGLGGVGEMYDAGYA